MSQKHLLWEFHDLRFHHGMCFVALVGLLDCWLVGWDIVRCCCCLAVDRKGLTKTNASNPQDDEENTQYHRRSGDREADASAAFWCKHRVMSMCLLFDIIKCLLGSIQLIRFARYVSLSL